MTGGDYLEIIIIGWANDISGSLGNHFLREYKKAKDNHYSQVEFFSGLLNQHKRLVQVIDDLYYRDMNDFYIIEGIWESEGKNVEELQGQRPKKTNYSVNLFHLTNDPRKLGYNLWVNDINYIGISIAYAFDEVNKELGTFCYKDFQELIVDAIKLGRIKNPTDKLGEQTQQSSHKHQFEIFLRKTKNLEESKLNESLTMNTFDEYLRHLDLMEKSQKVNIDSSRAEEKNVLSKTAGWTALTYLLCKYFENGCILPTDTQVEAMDTPGIKKSTVRNKHTELRKEGIDYNHTENILSIKAFNNSYDLLIRHFKNSNLKAYEEVEKRSKVLKETYSAMLP